MILIGESAAFKSGEAKKRDLVMQHLLKNPKMQEYFSI